MIFLLHETRRRKRVYIKRGQCRVPKNPGGHSRQPEQPACSPGRRPGLSGLERPELADPQILKTETELMEKRLFKIRRD